MLEAHYTPREPRVPVSDAVASLAPARESRRLRVPSTAGEQPAADADILLDLSSKGIKVQTAAALEVDQVFDVELRYPGVPGLIGLQGRVKWVQPEGEAFCVGIHFEHLRDTTQVALNQLLALERGPKR